MNKNGSWQKCVLCWEGGEVETMEEREAFGLKGLTCKECQAFLADELKESFNAKPLYKPVTGMYTPYVAQPNCQHHLQPLRIGKNGKWTVYLSSIMAVRTVPPKGPLPTACVYLSHQWLDNGIYANDGTITRYKDDPAVLYVDWPDGAAVEIETLKFAIGWIKARIEKRNAVIEIGCIGGHGRTGTLAAAVLVKSGMNATDAIAYVKKEYCTKAIETAVQRKVLYEYEIHCRGRADAVWQRYAGDEKRYPSPASHTYAAYGGQGLDNWED